MSRRHWLASYGEHIAPEIFIDAMPKSNVGKILRKDLRGMA